MIAKEYNEKCDIWSCGVILYILLSGVPPFNGNDDNEILANVSSGKYSFSQETWKWISPAAKKFIGKMLEFNPDKRYSAEDALKDPWINSLTLSSESVKP